MTRCRELTPEIIERYGKMGKRAETAAEVLAGRIVLEYAYDKPRQRSDQDEIRELARNIVEGMLDEGRARKRAALAAEGRLLDAGTDED